MMELKPCPFCGGEAHLRQYYDYEDKISYCYVYCNCGARTSVYMRKHNAIRVWNKRSNSWNTGTPTDEGDYLLIIKAPKGVPHYFANQLNSKGKWRYVYRGNIIAWQKITLYKEK